MDMYAATVPVFDRMLSNMQTWIRTARVSKSSGSRASTASAASTISSQRDRLGIAFMAAFFLSWLIGRASLDVP